MRDICLREFAVGKGGYFLEALVSGSKTPAEDGQLVILAAGEKLRSIKTLIDRSCLYLEGFLASESQQQE